MGQNLQNHVAGTHAPRLYHRALVVRFGGLGDILLATPSVRALAEHFPGIQIDFMVGKGLAPVLTGIPYIHRVIEFDKNGPDATVEGMKRYAGELAARGYDLFLNLHPSIKTVLLGLATRARRQIVFVKNRRRDPVTGRVPHAIDDFAKELQRLGITNIGSKRMDFCVGEDARKRVADLLCAAEMGNDDRLLVVNPAATRDINRWPVDRFAAVCDYFAGMGGTRVVLTGGPDDRALVDELKLHSANPERLIDFCGRVSIKELGALLERADVFLTCDTGPMHIASALNTPLVCLSGAADPDRTGPLNENSTVLIDRSLPCVSCQARTCRFGDDIRCMTGLTVSGVVAAVRAQLENRRSVRLPVS